MSTLMFIWHHSSSRTLELLPWFMLAIVLGRLLQALRLDVLTAGGLRRRNATAILGVTLFGSLTPFCACAIVPIIRSVLRAGVPLSVVMSFWISSPAMAPEEFGLTAKVFGIKIAIVRLAAAITLGIAAAAVALLLERRGLLNDTSRDLIAERAQAASCCAAGAPSATAPAGTALATAPAGTALVTAPAGTALATAPAGTALATAPAGERTTLLTLSPLTTATPATRAAPAAVASSPATPTCCGPASPASQTSPNGAAAAASFPATPTCCGPASPASPNGAAAGGGQSDPETRAAAPGWFSLTMQSLREIDIREFARSALGDSWTLGRWMLLGILIEALVARFVRPTAFGGLLGGHNLVLAVIIAGLLSIPLYLNGVSALPIGAALMSMGLNPAALITFLLAGSITTIPAMAGVRSIVTNRVFALYMATGVIGPMIIGLLIAPIMN